jgi:hypothetical protein
MIASRQTQEKQRHKSADNHVEQLPPTALERSSQ